jgi:signal transduction histidine kinase
MKTKNNRIFETDYFSLDYQFAQSLVDIVAAELKQSVIITDNRGVIIAAFHRERVSSVHEGAARMLSSGRIHEFSISAADVYRLKNVREGFNVPIVAEETCVGVIGVTGNPDEAAPYARLAAHFVQAALESNVRKEKLMQTMREKEELKSILLNKMIEVQEEERRKISRELHDETSQSLTSIIVGLKMLSEKISSEDEKAQIVMMREVVARTLDEVHRIALELRPVMLDDLGLAAAAKRYIKNYSQQHGIKVIYNFAGISRERFKPEIEISLYRILQETLTNIAKYAQATQIEISLKKTRELLEFCIMDNGIGFDVESLKSASAKGSLGIHGMRERVALLGGTFIIDAVEGAGTTVKVEILTGEKKSAQTVAEISLEKQYTNKRSASFE